MQARNHFLLGVGVATCLVIIFLFSLMTGVVRPAFASSTYSMKPKKCMVTQKEFRSYARKVYKRDSISKKAIKALDRRRACASSAKAAKNMLKYQRALSKQRKERIWQRSVTPYPGPNGTRWAVPWYIVYCESRGRNLAPNGAGASGYYQFIPSTWQSVGGSGHAYLASKAEQDARAHRLYAGGAGAGHWDCA